MGPPLALCPKQVLAGLSDPAPEAPGGVELAVGPLTELELEATQLPATISDCASSLSWISTMFDELGVVVLALAP